MCCGLQKNTEGYDNRENIRKKRYSKLEVLDNYFVKFSRVHKEWVTLFVWPSIKHTSNFPPLQICLGLGKLLCVSLWCLRYTQDILRVVQMCLYGGLQPNSHPAACLLPPCQGRTGGRKLMGQDKDRKIPYQLPSWPKWTQLGEN